MFVKLTLDLTIDLYLETHSAEKMQRSVLGGATVDSGFYLKQGTWGCLVILLRGLVSSPLLHLSTLPNLLFLVQS